MARARTFQLDDHVRLRNRCSENKDEVAVVARTWHDEEGMGPPPVPDDGDPMNRNLEEGEYGIGFVPSRRRAIVKEEELDLLDRTFALGQLCKLQAVEGSMSGVITKVERHVEVEHVVSKQRIASRVPAGEVRPASCIQNGDHVAFGQWIGVVMDIYIEGMLKTSWSPSLLRFGKILDQHFQLGPMHDFETAPSPIGVPWTERSFNDARPSLMDLRETVVYIDWLAINPNLSSEEQERFPKPKSFWTDLDELTSLRQEYNRLYILDDIVMFKTPELRDRYGLVPTDSGPIVPPMEAMRVVATHSRVHVCWQDGSQTEHESHELRLHTEIDENDAYRGEHVLFRDGEGEERGAVIDTIDPVERIAQVRPYGSVDQGPVTMSVLDLKTAGAPGFQSSLPRGYVVLLAPHLNAFAPPQVSRIGAREPLNGLTDAEIDDTLQNMGDEIRQDTSSGPLPAQRRPRLAEAATEVDWYGIVVDLRLDGQAVVRLPSRREVNEKLENVAILQDGFLDEDASLGDMHTDDTDMYEEDAPWMTEDGEELEADDWEDVAEAGLNEVHEIILEQGEEDLSIAPSATPLTTSASAEESLTKNQDGDNLLGPCKSFEILEEAPRDHAYYDSNSGSGTPPKKYLSRLQREYKILQSSLPNDILVRAYEDRTDLLRALIIGSAGTPYEDAPICIDFQLKPTYPDEAPLAFFHSWTEGHGRLSPNLYEDGNICLSVLGTWTGEASESWNPAKSTLLQVLVSIQGLVLVAEPYYTEPGFERQRETDSGRSNSRHYSERAYVQARRAVLHALKHPVASFDRELRHLYFGAGRLETVIVRGSALVANAIGPSDGTDSISIPDSAWGSSGKLSKGSALALQRIVDSLKTIREQPAIT